MGTLRSLAALVVLFGVCSIAGAEEPQKREVTTSGEAVIFVTPDEVTLTFGVEAKGGALDKVVADVESQSKGLLAVIRGQGVPEEQIGTERLELFPVTERLANDTVFNGFVGKRTYNVTLKKVDGLEKLVQAVLKSGMASIMGGVEFKLSTVRVKKDEARVMACRAAREKAELLAGALGAKVGRPMQIVETGSWPGPSLRLANSNRQEFEAGGDAGESSVPTGQIAIRGSVSVTFELMDLAAAPR